MSNLSPVSVTTDDGVPVFQKVLELFAGGFSVILSGKETVRLPKGSLLKVDEAARTAIPIKSAALLATSTTTKFLVTAPNMFQVGDHVMIEGNGTGAHSISTIVASGVGEEINIATAIGIGATGAVMYQAASQGTAAADILPNVIANAVSMYDSTVGDFVTCVLRGTAFKKRIQPHLAGHLTDIKFIHFSTSY